jgi:hypothetical protein
MPRRQQQLYAVVVDRADLLLLFLSYFYGRSEMKGFRRFLRHVTHRLLGQT